MKINNSFKIWYCFLFLAFIATRISFSQSGFENLTIRDGLSSNVVYFIFKDSRGFIWFCTDGGLNRYDSKTVRAFKHNPQDSGSIPVNIVSSMYQRTGNELLLLGNNGEIISYKYSTGRFQSISNNIPYLRERAISYIHISRSGDYWLATETGLLHTDKHFNKIHEYIIQGKINPHPHANKVNIIVEDKKGEFWLGMYFRGLMTFSPKTGKFSSEQFVPAVGYNQVRTMQYLPGADCIYVSAEGVGVLKFDIYNYSFKKYPFRRGDANTLPDNHVQAMGLQGDSVLWMGHLQGLSKLNLHTDSFEHFQNDPYDQSSLINNWIAYLYLDNQEILWVATFGGVSMIPVRKPRFQKFFFDPSDSYTLPSNTVQSAYKDKKGNIWFGTSMGFGIMPPGGRRIFRYAVPRKLMRTENSEVSSFLEDGDFMWLGSWGSGLARTRLPHNFKAGDRLSFSEFSYDSSDAKSLSSNFVRNLSRDSDGNILISTWNGGINIIPAALKGEILLSFTRVRGSKNKSKGLGSDFVESIIPDEHGNLWCLIAGAVQRINLKKNEYEIVRVFPDSAQHLLNACTNLIRTKKGDFYGSSFGGLVHITKGVNGAFQSFQVYADVERGTYSLLEDKEGNIWFSTVRSEIGRYEPESGNLRFYSLVEEVNGFDFYLGRAAADNAGNMYFVGKSGVLVFNPASISDNDFAPPVFLSSIRVQGKEQTFSRDICEVKSLDLRYNEKGITISFAGLNYLKGSGNKYRYRIAGEHDRWIYLGKNPVISFYELKPGNHTLILSASNNDGVWSRNDRLLTINVHPPFWDTMLFKIGGILAGLLLIVGFFTNRIRVLRQERAKQNLFSQRLIESQESARKSLSKELHDGVGQNLLVVKNWLTLYLNSPEKDEEDLQKINELVQEAIQEVKELSMNLHPNLLDKLGFTKAIKSMIKKLNDLQVLTITTSIDTIDAYLTKESEINLYRIIQECLNNILKHASATEASVSIVLKEKTIVVSVSDNGRGFDPALVRFDEHKTGLGLTSLQERSNYIGARLTLHSAPGKGTVVTLILEKKERLP